MYSPECSQRLAVSKVKVAERGKHAIILNPSHKQFIRTQVDGCLIKGNPACDWWIVREDLGSVLIELKGCDVSHALDQIEATFSHLKQKSVLTHRMAALIVCRNPTSHPRFTSKLQRAKARLASHFQAPLHVVCGNYEFELDCLLSHKGPFRTV